MAITTHILEDTPEYTVTETIDTVLKSRSVTTVYKPGSPAFNQQALTQRAQAAIATLDTAETLLNAGNGAWDAATSAQRTALMLALVRQNRVLIRLALNQLDSPS